MKSLGKLELWLDPAARPGPEAMAVDEWLLETAVRPVLRIYRWAGDWVSIGYFGEIRAARDAFPGLPIVRRWTGGGVVDHRLDWTYSLVVPRSEPLANLRGAESYRQIHVAVAEMLGSCGVRATFCGGGDSTGAVLCFENPVWHDLVGEDGKLAGAGQRRSRSGLLHQGSVRNAAGADLRGRVLAAALAKSLDDFQRSPDAEDLAVRIAARYGNPVWTNRR